MNIEIIYVCLMMKNMHKQSKKEWDMAHSFLSIIDLVLCYQG